MLVSSVCYRSDDARPGALFFCVPGSSADGHAFARRRGLARVDRAIVVDRWLDAGRAPDRTCRTSAAAMGPISAAFYGRPADAMTVVGVTGTNGKTTTTFLLEAIFRADGRTPGVIGTTGIRIDGRPEPFPRTTPEAPDLQRLIAEMADEGVTASRDGGLLARAAISTASTASGTRWRCSPTSRRITSTTTRRWRRTSSPRRGCSRRR